MSLEFVNRRYYYYFRFHSDKGAVIGVIFIIVAIYFLSKSLDYNFDELSVCRYKQFLFYFVYFVPF
jgi:hypothetical protein